MTMCLTTTITARSHSNGFLPVNPLKYIRQAAGCVALFALATALSNMSLAQDVKAGLLQPDFPFQGACIGTKFPTNNVALKGLAIRLGTAAEANVLFDTELLRMAAGWTGGYITTHGVAFDGGHGSYPQIVGQQRWGTPSQPGWADSQGSFKDPRKEPFGALPAIWCRWDGIHLHGSNVVLHYTVHGTKITEQPEAQSLDGETIFTRHFRIDRAEASLNTILAGLPEGALSGTIGLKDGLITLTQGTNLTVIGLSKAPKGVQLSVDAHVGSAHLQIAKGTRNARFAVRLWTGPADHFDPKSFAAVLKQPSSIVAFNKGGPAHWPQTVTTKGALNTSTTPDKAYATDSITAPTENPWKRRIRFAGFDFFSDGKRAALCTHDGDVWIVSGIDDKLENLTWRRFASGQYETLGLTIVDDVVYTSGRDQITRYHDLNGDGEADYYENFNNEYMSTEGFHEFLFDLQRDKAGNFYFAKANPVNAGGGGFGNQKASKGNGTVCSQSGSLFRLSKDGKKLETYATGFRAPNGIGVSPEGQLTSSDNEGTWVPTTPIHWIREGQFCGVINNLTPKERADSYVPPLCWLSKSYDNSGGGQIWVTSSKWGPYQGELLHESYGQSSLFLVMKQALPNGQMQGGVVKFPLRFTSSVMRAHFHPFDGQLYVCGLSEWQSNAGKITGFDRVRYTGATVYSVRGLTVDQKGVHLTFTQPLSKESAEDPQNYSAKRWNYKRSENYGSPEFSVADPTKKARDSVAVTGAKLSEDGLHLTLQIEDLKPVMQQTVKFNLKAKDGTAISQEIMHTIHQIP